jgi:hypothetical protein
MTIIGYARVSTTDQDLSIQEAALRAAGCEVIRAEKRSGTTIEGREDGNRRSRDGAAFPLRDMQLLPVSRGRTRSIRPGAQLPRDCFRWLPSGPALPV